MVSPDGGVEIEKVAEETPERIFKAFIDPALGLQGFQARALAFRLGLAPELVGKAVILTDGKAGTVDGIWLDELHGLRISIRGHEGKWPISTVKLAQG